MSYLTLSSQEKHPFLLCSDFRAHHPTTLLKILGGMMHGPSPTSNFGGDRPPKVSAPVNRPCDLFTKKHLPLEHIGSLFHMHVLLHGFGCPLPFVQDTGR